MATKPLLFLTSKQVQRLHGLWINASAHPSQPHLLESAVHSPIDVHHYTNQEDVFQLAANLSEKIMKNHPYQDGNKRTGLVAVDMFLKVNGYRLLNAPLKKDQVNMDLANAQVAAVTNQWSASRLGNYYESLAMRSRPSISRLITFSALSIPENQRLLPQLHIPQ
ncbi:hypothetical protein PRK78_006027 [Emydomyces testavorans]|uniref:Fido domain-containing protein n=1 Tax=Emydomyces testavorans TaxID=2070801 RepID=A0AAF0DKN8_9EURO|nr:hypothetical protein PRK78_006027 [Emydomyces testavorans]